MTGSYVFTGVCLLTFAEGRGYPILPEGVTPIFPMGEVTLLFLKGGYPNPSQGYQPQGTPIQIRFQVRIGGITPSRSGPRSGGYPGIPPIVTGTRWEYPPPVRRQSSIASICYAASGMPLAFTQEDFLVLYIIHLSFMFFVINRKCSKPRVDITRSPKEGVSVAPWIWLFPKKFTSINCTLLGHDTMWLK